jgi:hypothetical protein
LSAVAFELMHAVGAAGSALAKCQAGTSPGVNAGMTFTMLRGVEPLLGGPVESALIRERLLALAKAAAGITVLPSEIAASLQRCADVLRLG